MKNQIHLSSRSEARRGNAPSIICHRGGAWPVLLLMGCCALLTALAHPARAAVTEAWVQRYSVVVSNSTDQAFAVVSDAAGDIIVAGSTDDGITGQDMLTIKYSGADGSVLWQKRYNGPANSDDFAIAVVLDGKGNVVVTGSSIGSEGDYNYYTTKYAAADGVLLWEKRYNGVANSSDEAKAVAADGSGNVVVTGSSQGDFYTAKYADANGDLLWENRGLNGAAAAVAVDGSGNVVVTGYSYGTNGFHYYTAKYAAADGALLWEKRYNGGAANSLALGPNGMVVITGSSGGDYATVVYREALPPLSIDLVPTGIRLRFTGVPSSSFNIERAPAVNGPWTTINTQTAPPSGLIEYLDTNPPIGAAFFRTRAP